MSFLSFCETAWAVKKDKAKINEIIENARKNITDYKVTEMSEKDFAKEWVKLENCRN